MDLGPGSQPGAFPKSEPGKSGGGPNVTLRFATRVALYSLHHIEELGIMKKLKLLLSLGLLALPCTGLLADSVYKWVDEHGTVHYSDKKPHSQAQTLSVKSGKATSTAPDPYAQLDELNRQQEADQIAQAQAAEAAEEQQRRKAACEAAQRGLETLTNHARVRVEENGNLRYLTPEEIVETRERYQQIAADNC